MKKILVPVFSVAILAFPQTAAAKPAHDGSGLHAKYHESGRALAQNRLAAAANIVCQPGALSAEPPFIYPGAAPAPYGLAAPQEQERDTRHDWQERVIQNSDRYAN